MLGLLMLAGGLAEVVSLGAVIPFLAVLAAPETALSHPAAEFLFSMPGFVPLRHGMSGQLAENPTTLIILFATGFSLAALGAGGLRILLLWLSVRLANAAGADLGLEVYRRTLYQPYAVHVSQNTSSIISCITSKVGAVTGVLGSCLAIGCSAFISLAIIGALFFINYKVTLAALIGIGFSYAFIIKRFNTRLINNSGRLAREKTELVKAVQEGLGGIRDILLDGTQPIYCDIFSKADGRLRRASASNQLIAQSPRFFLEAVGMVMFAVLALVLAQGSEGVVSALPILGALALGVQRILPALQQIYAGWTGIKGAKASTQDVLEILEKPLPPEARLALPRPLVFKKSIEFNCVSFRYAPEAPWVLRRISFAIRKGSKVGIVGKTGSGKSTCMDLLMGLLEPSEGRILIDGKTLNKSLLRSWQRAVAHVPQAIFLSDSTLAENIAFGTPFDQIAMDRVQAAARRAQIADFIESSPKGYLGLVGERGIRLSGGQRQRIGIARALYKQSKILIFDEATSALDGGTEKAVLETIKKLNSNITVLLVAHRISSLRNCDEIIEIPS